MFYEKVCESVNYIKSKSKHEPQIGIILGSGLGKFGNAIEDGDIIPFSDIPHFPVSKVQGHSGKLILGKIKNKTVAVFQGRVHFYEGFDMKSVAYPVYVLKLLGADSLIVTNACGGINKGFEPGDLMLHTDFINILGTNPLIGENDERFGVRFPDMTEAYSSELLKKAQAIAHERQIDFKEGVYAIFNGPCYETAAEIRAFSVLGADAIGMSTVPEVIAANYLSMKVLGISCITNMATGIAKTKHSHEEVLRIASESSEKMENLITAMLEKW